VFHTYVSMLGLLLTVVVGVSHICMYVRFTTHCRGGCFTHLYVC